MYIRGNSFLFVSLFEISQFVISRYGPVLAGCVVV
jgi:hypothetical protein